MKKNITMMETLKDLGTLTLFASMAVLASANEEERKRQEQKRREEERARFHEDMDRMFDNVFFGARSRAREFSTAETVNRISKIRGIGNHTVSYFYDTLKRKESRMLRSDYQKLLKDLNEILDLNVSDVIKETKIKMMLY